MPWVKLDDNFFDHPKIVAAGRDARDLYLAGLCYCARNLTDGFIPEERVARLAIEAGVADAKTAVTRLSTVIRGTRCPLWETVDGGYQVHDYLDYNPTREQVIALRELRAEAGREGGVKSGETRRAKSVKQTRSKREANALANAKQNPSKTEPHAHAPQSPNGDAAKPAPVGRKEHQAFYAVICREWGDPTNDIERGRYNVAAKNFSQARCRPDDVRKYRAEYEKRWPRVECTPLAVASNVKTLRDPPRNGQGPEPAQRILSGEEAVRVYGEEYT